MPVIDVHNNMGVLGEPRIKVFTRAAIASCTRFQKVYGTPKVYVEDYDKDLNEEGRYIELQLTRDELALIDWSRVLYGYCFPASISLMFSCNITLANRGNVGHSRVIFFDEIENTGGVFL